MIYAGFPPFFGLGLKDFHVPAFWLLLQGYKQQPTVPVSACIAHGKTILSLLSQVGRWASGVGHSRSTKGLYVTVRAWGGVLSLSLSTLSRCIYMFMYSYTHIPIPVRAYADTCAFARICMRVVHSAFAPILHQGSWVQFACAVELLEIADMKEDMIIHSITHVSFPDLRSK